MLKRVIQIAISDPKRVQKVALWHSRRFIWRQIGHTDYKKFIVIAGPRTGSSLLVDGLDSHPAILAEHEIFINLKGRSEDAILNKMYSKVSPATKAVGFKIFYLQPYDDDTKLIWTKLQNMADLYVIHLKRRNLLRVIASTDIAIKTKVWIGRKGRQQIPLEEKQVHLAYESVLKRFEQIRGNEEKFKLMFQDKKYMDIFYEDIINNPKDEFQRATDMLELDPFTPKWDILKQNPEKLSNLIINYAELKAKFQDTKWYSFFED